MFASRTESYLKSTGAVLVKNGTAPLQQYQVRTSHHTTYNHAQNPSVARVRKLQCSQCITMYIAQTLMIPACYCGFFQNAPTHVFSLHVMTTSCSSRLPTLFHDHQLLIVCTPARVLCVPRFPAPRSDSCVEHVRKESVRCVALLSRERPAPYHKEVSTPRHGHVHVNFL